LQEELRIRHGSGTFGKWLIQLAKTDVLVLDDWGMGAIDGTTRSDLLEIIDDRAANRATIITSQLLRSRTRKAEGFLVSDCGYQHISESI
jgi:DNA replication protein DnaC